MPAFPFSNRHTIRTSGSSVSLIALLTLSVSTTTFAATDAPVAKPGEKPRHATPASAHKPSAKAHALTSNTAENIGIEGHRQANWVSNPVSAATIREYVAGTNPLKALTRLPGVLFNSGDPQGVNTWQNSFLMHGFDQSQIGMTLDGIPLGDQQFSNVNGLSPTSAISSENIERMDVSASTGSESVASTSNLGGTVQFISRDPSHKRGASVNQTFGSNEMYRTFLRLESGDLNPQGTRFYVSYARNDTNKWRGGQDQFMQQVNAKVLHPIGQDSRITAFFDYADLQMQNYQDYSLDMFNHGGYAIDNFIGQPGGYEKAYRLALAQRGLPGGQVPAAYANLKSPYTASYYEGAQMQHSYIGGVSADLALTDRLRWQSTAYGHRSYQRGSVASPLIASPNGAPLIDQVTQPDTDRFGFTTSLSYRIAHNVLNAGLWYENTHFDISKPLYQEPLLEDVLNGTATPVNGLDNLKNPFQNGYRQVFNTNTFVAYFQDTYHVTNTIALHAGFRSVLNTSRVGALANWQTYTRTTAIAGGDSLTSSKPFLPHFSGEWRFAPGHQLYFDIAENVKVYPVSGYNSGSSPFSTSQASYLASKSSLQPETDWNFAGGYRYTGRLISGSLYGYHTIFSNRLQRISTGPTTQPYTTIQNVGGVTMSGVDGAVTLTPVKGLNLTNSISYNHAVYDDNITQTINGSRVTYNIKGQQVVAYPRLMYHADLSYTWHDLQAHIEAQYVGKRNLSYTGDTKVPSYWLTNFGARYDLSKQLHRLSHTGFVQHLSLDFNVYNLTNVKYISTMGQNGYPMTGDYQSVVLGAPRQYFGAVHADF